MVRKGNEAQRLPVVIDIKRRPSPVFRLHRNSQFTARLTHAFLSVRIDARAWSRAEQDHRGIVDVRVKFVREFEVPSRWLNIRTLN